MFEDSDFVIAFNRMAAAAYKNSADKGFHDVSRGFATEIALIHSELSEALEGDRRDLMDDKLPMFKSAEVELADAIIRIMDSAEARGYKLAEAIIAKHAYNLTRERMHGKKY